MSGWGELYQEIADVHGVVCSTGKDGLDDESLQLIETKVEKLCAQLESFFTGQKDQSVPEVEAQESLGKLNELLGRLTALKKEVLGEASAQVRSNKYIKAYKKV